jgi:hypothetical protein
MTSSFKTVNKCPRRVSVTRLCREGDSRERPALINKGEREMHTITVQYEGKEWEVTFEFIDSSRINLHEIAIGGQGIGEHLSDFTINRIESAVEQQLAIH